MNNLSAIERLCKKIECGDDALIDDLIKCVDRMVSNDEVYYLDEEIQGAIFRLQEDVSRFNSNKPLLPDPGFIGLDGVRHAVRNFYNEINERK